MKQDSYLIVVPNYPRGNRRAGAWGPGGNIYFTIYILTLTLI